MVKKRGAPSKYFVYKHTSPSGKVYIGITSQTKPEYRWGKNGNRYNNNEHFYRAIQKYGWGNIKHEILCEGLNKEEACKKEIELITKYKSNNAELGYNICSGGEINIFSEETRKKLSKSHKGLLKGKPSYRKGIPLSEEHKQKISMSNKGKSRSKGKKLSEETIEKIKLNQPNSRSVIQLDKNKNIVAKFNSLAEAERETNIGRRMIQRVCEHKRNITHGYLWEYEKEGVS